MARGVRPLVVSDSEEGDVVDGDQTTRAHRTYPRRWFVLTVSSVAVALRGYNQSCFGTINNLYSDYFSVEPWQVDWFVLIQSVIFFFASMPMTIVTKTLSFRITMFLLTSTLTGGFMLTSTGMLTSKGYSIVLLGQAIEGFSNILSWSLPPATAAVWFASDEVAMAVAVQVVARGIGEAAGCIVPPVIVNINTEVPKARKRLFEMFGGLAGIALTLFLFCFLIPSGPPTPPSESQAKALQFRREERKEVREKLKSFWSSIKKLFKSKTFVVVWFIFGAVNPVLRTNNVLLSSMMHSRFLKRTDIDMEVGIALAVAWSMYTVGGFAAGPLLNRTRKYKEIVTASVALMLATGLVVLIGSAAHNLYTVFGGIMAQGLFLGVANASIFELLVEVTYPEPAMFVTMLAIVIMGVFRLLYPIIGRALLTAIGVTISTSVPVAFLLLCFVLLLLLKPEYKRQLANADQEQQTLLQTGRTSK